MKHTPKPWKMVSYNIKDHGKDGDWCGHIIAENGTKPYRGAMSFHAINIEANARLMTVSPELYDLLNEWLDTPFFETRDEWQKWVDDYKPRVLQAIAKVEGKNNGTKDT